MKKIAFAIVLLASPAIAQQQPDPETLQRVLAAMREQRNAALDAVAMSEARAAKLEAELEKLKAELAKAKQQ